MKHTVYGEPSFHLATPELNLDITARGGHLAPVVFHLPGRDVSPYALAPWQPADYPAIPPLLSVLRGDFLCLPFGGQENGPPHGDPANAEWLPLTIAERSLELSMHAADSGAHVVKTISVKTGHHAIYAEHRISNLDGHFNYGTHPILDLSHLPEGSGRVTTSPFRWASTFPSAFSNPADGESQSLLENSVFTDLREVKLADGGTTDLTHYPARVGNDDLVMMVNVPATPQQPFAWSAAVLDGYVWFSLKNPADFPATLLWLTNGGRSAPPWNGKHLGRIGIEEVCSFFSHGVNASRQNQLAAEGIPTTRHFVPQETVSLRVIQAVALVPDNFGAITTILPHDELSVAISGESGKPIIIPIDWKFVL
jgi:hypothetical protein